MSSTRERKDSDCPRHGHDTSPVKTVLGSLNTTAQSSEVTVRPGERQQAAGDSLNIKVPRSIEEVPFRLESFFKICKLIIFLLSRRQDIRILIAKNRRMMDRLS